MDLDLDDRVAFGKLQTINEIRRGQLQLERVRQRLLTELEVSDAEGRSLLEYRREMDLLLQEKMAHVEELRQIHADMNAIEEVVKQSEEARSRSLESARRLHAEYRPLKGQLDRMRQQLGLAPLVDIADLEPDLPVNELLEQGSQQAEQPPAPGRSGPAERPESGLHPVVGSGSGSGGSYGGLSAGQPHRVMVLAKSEARSSQMVAGGPSPTPFRQQPPPMKSCLSCHQQIHRNAPICPLCKAKSRSRNPKKPKKKD
ncbi:zinc finger C4H2 domain-containing protein-like [Amphibalanus amphitrite]|uniref:zinc finger C4H2 domain-containing protein-like n=1 Tax=Amphibalanus amphitrite TaxID=1232801 RepID=UPI001C926969|nr:zinc finger C4H2 domain-containing protein-like [Amphibalanus amphitrite]XP_043231515.1 zinc finger C4H2 domain-containing protein-like [Amphibalanus amphitrite]XP_043231516.1 zinc finger C4H2 domain-containing protein-like [Amphibalanus amphitrite]XP_043231517.1 zinc finger C4H2 domain-containing protein-like [Amphibalanus amphitrite]